MNQNHPAHWLLLPMFCALNAAFFYLFLLKLPIGIDPFVLSLVHWQELGSQVPIAALLAFAVAMGTLIALQRMPEELKCKFIYLRRTNAHPAYSAFFNTRRTVVDYKVLLEKIPAIKDSAYDPKVQFEVWQSLAQKHRQVAYVASTVSAWNLLRDLTSAALMFVAAFLVAWPINPDLHPQIGLSYLFVFGAQWFFLLLAARGTGFRQVDNVLAAELGMEAAKRMTLFGKENQD